MEYRVSIEVVRKSRKRFAAAGSSRCGIGVGGADLGSVHDDVHGHGVAAILSCVGSLRT